MDRNVLCYGSSQSLPERVALGAGPLHLFFEQGDLRSVCLGEHEVLRRIYVAVRDSNWGTVGAVFSNMDVRIQPDRFQIYFDVENRAGEIYFAWHGEIRGEADGSLVFRMEGAARSSFAKNRLGFCVLHPAGLSGQEAEVEHIDGSREAAQFAVDLCADQPVKPFSNLRAIRHLVRPGVWAEVSFQGDIFEMEDQRLWSDASFKTFCTPLSLPYPVEIQAGTQIVQSVTVKLISEHSFSVFNLDVLAPDKWIKVLAPAAEDWRPVPDLGVSVSCQVDTLSERELARLCALHLHHLRVELRLSETGYEKKLRQAVDQASALKIELEIALALRSGTVEEDLRKFRKLIDQMRPVVCGWLVFPEREPYTGGNPSEEIARWAWEILKPFDPSVPLAVGTNTDFIFLKRTRLPLTWMDQVTITLNPQVHAFDNQSIIETLEAQPMVIAGARRLAQGKPVVVSPVTLKPRFNPYVTGVQPQVVPGELPASVDPRQLSLFAAGWTLGSLGAMIKSGVERVTYYETVGWQGLMEMESGSPLPERFPSQPGGVYPLYNVLALIGDFAGGEASALHPLAPLKVSALALRHQGRTRSIFANHTSEGLEVSLEGITGQCKLHAMDEGNFGEMPSVWPGRVENGILRFKMRPFGLIWCDWIGLSRSD